MNIREIEGVNLDRDLRQYRLEEKFVAYVNPKEPSALMSFPDAVRLAAGMSDEACVGFVSDEPAPVATDYSKPLPGILSRRKQKL